MRATWYNVRNRGGRLQGGSTITQQLAWNLFLTHEQTIARKLKELVLTLRLERSFSKDEILELYLNAIYFGEGAYGVGTASRQFFGKPPNELSLSESALLAGIPKHPARYSPTRHPADSKRRRNVVLGAMLDVGSISRGDYERAVSDTLRVSPRATVEGSSWGAPYFTELIRKELIDRFGSEATYEGGLKVYTTLDFALQEVAEAELEKQLVSLEETNAYAYLDNGADLGDSAIVNGASSRLQGAVVVLDPTTGAVRALVGGRSFRESEFNRATQAKRQPGSSFKPFVFATAIEAGWVPTDILIDEPIVRFFPNGDRWEPTNFSNRFRGLVTLREAITHSINIPAVLLLEEIGIDRVIQTARKAGIESRLPHVVSLALGTGEVSLLELTSAYGPLANHGIYSTPYFITRVEDKSGQVIFDSRPETREALREDVSYVVTDLLRNALNRGTGTRARQLGLVGDFAGKTGTTDEYSDAWFVGYSTNFLAGVWVGFDELRPIGKGMTGGKCALPVWTGVAKANAAEHPPQSFQVPRNVRRLTVCTETNRQATRYCPDVIEEIFIEGTEPDFECPIHEAPPAQFFRRP